MKSANDLTQGVIWKQLVKYSLPLIATSVMQSLYSLFDILIAGRFLGSAGISGINNSSQVLGIVNTVVIGLSMGGTILIGRLFGQGEKSKMQNASNTFINSFFIMGIIMSVVLYFVSPMIITLMKTPAYNEAVSYFKVCAIGVFFTFCYNALSGVMRAVGNSKMPMYCIFVSTTVNIVLDIIFMGVIKLGTAGAALATVIAQGISFFMALGFVLKQKDMWTSLKIYDSCRYFVYCCYIHNQYIRCCRVSRKCYKYETQRYSVFGCQYNVECGVGYGCTKLGSRSV